MDKLVQVPELVALVASRLEDSSLALCVRLSKSWNATFVPFLWGSFGLGRKHRPICFGAPESRRSYTIDHMGIAHYTRPEYPPPGTSLHPQKEPATWWQRLFDGEPLDERHLETAQAIFAKYGPHVRTLAIRTAQAFYLAKPHCTSITGFQLLQRLSDNSVRKAPALPSDLTESTRLIQDVLHFLQQRPNMRSLRLRLDFDLDRDQVQALFSLRKDWRHFEVPLGDQEYRDVLSLLPNALSVCFQVASNTTLARPLDSPHTGLRELEIQLPSPMFHEEGPDDGSFDHDTFAAILQSFPNLERLYVVHHSRYNGAGALDLTRSNAPGGGRSMLTIDAVSGLCQHLARLVPLLPDLAVFQYFDLREEVCIEALAQHCPHLTHVLSFWDNSDYGKGSWYDWHHADPPRAMNRLLRSCPDLVDVIVPEGLLHPRVVAEEGPWACNNLRTLRCELAGYSFLHKSQGDVETLLTLWSEQNYRGRSLTLSEEDRAIMDKIDERERVRQLIQDHVARYAPQVVLDDSVFGNLNEYVPPARST